MFQIGDTVIGNDENRYGITCFGRRGIVIDIRNHFGEDQIKLKCYPDDASIDRARGFHNKWDEYTVFWVSASKFDLYDPHETVSLSEYIMGVQ